MKKNLLYILVMLLVFGACDLDYEDNPNEAAVPPTFSIFNDAVKEMVDDSRDSWFHGRFTLGTMQYWCQTEYTEEDRYQYRESMRETWEDFYINLENFRKVIEFNEDEILKVEMSKYGSNANQIAVSRIMIAWSFNMMADTWGDIPYWSYSTEDADFQALDMLTEVFAPAYASQSKIYPDLLKQLSEAADMLEISETVFSSGDPIYGGDASMWKKFANSLRLRIATKILAVYPGAQAHIDDAIADGVFTSNSDNAVLAYEANQTNGSPMMVAFETRNDFAITSSFVELLDGKRGSYGADPRLEKYAQPNQFGNYVGIPSGVSNEASVAFKWESLPGYDIIATDGEGTVWQVGTELLMTYAEVAFLLSENNSWDQTEYENGVKASMDQWGVKDADRDAFVATLPAASEENVMTQKYVALYMDGHTAWVDYRRSGYPTTLNLPGVPYSISVDTDGKGTIETFDYTFTPVNSSVTDIPYRMEYPSQESTLNEANYKAAVANLSEGNKITSKLWWDVN